VEEILHRETIFSVSPYLPRMMGVIGPFVLSQDITPGYDRDISVMRLVVRREDLSRVKDIVSRCAAGIVQTLFQGPGPVEIVQTLTRKVPVRLAAEYFGFAAPDDAQMMGWARACFREFFINLRNAPDMRAPAVAAGAEMYARLDALLTERLPGGGDGTDDVMGRLLRLRAAFGSMTRSSAARSPGWSSAWSRPPRRPRSRRCWCCSRCPTRWPKRCCRQGRR
jgi:cytochrome P450